MKKDKEKQFLKRNISIVILLGMFLNMLSFSDQLIRARNGDLVKVTAAPNGTPMIELANPNGSSISVNDFERLNVDEKNLILNNIAPSEGKVYRSELGGNIVPNENYTGAPARAVLIRVHNDPSVINGFIEAASTGKMDVFWSNPNGIYFGGNGGVCILFCKLSFL